MKPTIDSASIARRSRTVRGGLDREHKEKNCRMALDMNEKFTVLRRGACYQMKGGAVLESDRVKYVRIKFGMMQELLTGKTRLV